MKLFGKCLTLIALLGLSCCGTPDAGCISYQIAENSRPGNPEILTDPWLKWGAVDLDARMDAACKK